MKRREILGVLGAAGQGKSWYALYRARTFSRLILFDSIHNYDLAAERIAFTDDLAHLMQWTRERGAANEAFSGRPFHVAFLPLADDHGRAAQLDTLLRWAVHLGNCCVLVDEVDHYCEAASTPDAMKRIINYGRHREVSLIWTARRHSAVSRELTSQTTELAVFFQEEFVDVQAIARRIGPEAADRIRRLQERQCLLCERGQVRLWDGQQARPLADSCT